MEKLSQEKRDIKLIVYVLLMLSGYILNLYDLLFNLDFKTTWTDLYCIKQDLQYLGALLFCYHFCPFERLKLKTLLFMLISWQIFILILNPLEIYNIYFLSIPSIIYSVLILRIFLIKSNLETYDSTSPIKKTLTYNIFIPVHSFRGLIQAILLFWRDPRYETTILVNNDKVYYVKNKTFHAENKNVEIIERLVNKTHAKIKITHITPRKKRQINKLLYKRAIVGLKDCSKLKI